jgi:hypothetical protein
MKAIMRGKRDYIQFPAQTNGELYIQMKEAAYSNQSILKVHDVYMFVIDKFHTMYRGSGKPFISHLVGTASILVSCSKPIPIIQAALLHALYQNRIVFAGATSIMEKRTLVQSFFGDVVDDLVWRYTEFELSDKNDVPITDATSDIFILHVADEIEDLSSYGLSLHGKVGETTLVKGNSLFRKQKMEQQVHYIQAICQKLNEPILTEAVAYWYNFDHYDFYDDCIKTGFYSSWTVGS